MRNRWSGATKRKAQTRAVDKGDVYYEPLQVLPLCPVPDEQQKSMAGAERRLWISVLIAGISVALSKGDNPRTMIEEAVWWIKTREEHRIGGFDWICLHLSLPANEIRKWALKEVDKGSVGTRERMKEAMNG
jgi:hypothetical protein